MLGAEQSKSMEILEEKEQKNIQAENEERRMSTIDILMLFFTCAAIALVAFVIMEVLDD